MIFSHIKLTTFYGEKGKPFDMCLIFIRKKHVVKYSKVRGSREYRKEKMSHKDFIKRFPLLEMFEEKE